MLITCIELENIKSYRHIVIDFRRGTTAISGSNGAGKTTVVEAIGYALLAICPIARISLCAKARNMAKLSCI